jgi:hypothetical protein
MSGNEKNLEINFEQDMPIIAAAREKHVIPMPAISRRTLLVGGTAVGASLLLGRMATAKSPVYKLNNGIEMPALGLGVFHIPECGSARHDS